ncbi:uncharacterized protein An18g03880 [Aspergillus niger]|uniref:Contig An18c0120, genomic contig n=2 Tax=Aspergillus niger TaxID=5061 RepID=A2RAP4_ASPNC|nr:uncharacterized protein An18g03880 [Aspergillus niger]CAK97425.1 unnamed protein product [Aspergillus niger]
MSTTTTTPPLPTLIFIPGAWHQPTCYSKLITHLQTHHPDLHCTTITLPSTTGDPAATFKDDLDATRAAIITETIHHGRNVVLIAHSYGGMVANSAIKGFTSPSSPSSGIIIGLILIASGYTLTGLSFMDPFLGHPPPSWRANHTTGFAELATSPRKLFYHDLPEEEARYWVSQLRPQSLKALFEGGEYSYAGWKDVPSWYIGTGEDKGLPVLMQRVGVGMARGMCPGLRVVYREVEGASHSVFLSRVEVVGGLVWEAVGSFMGREVGGDGDGDNWKSQGVVVPEADVWKVSTWLKFGVPAALGRVVGWGFGLYGWVRVTVHSVCMHIEAHCLYDEIQVIYAIILHRSIRLMFI